MKPCVCGHNREFHEHNRAGTDCPIPGCACRRYQRRRWWHRNATQPLPPTASPGPQLGPLPRHDTGPVAGQTRRYRCGCELTYDGAGNITSAKGCRQVADLRQWDRELRP